MSTSEGTSTIIPLLSEADSKQYAAAQRENSDK